MNKKYRQIKFGKELFMIVFQNFEHIIHNKLTIFVFFLLYNNSKVV
jgi:hypothetical protein